MCSLGKELVEYRLRVLDESLLVLRQSLEKQGKQGVLQRWQRNIVEARGEVDDDEYSWRSKSCIVSPRQF
ncbi:hypothetical protein EON64_00920 [archaeon]|nr:MAG: hypothetical protein EON64_00920 [archaeon]